MRRAGAAALAAAIALAARAAAADAPAPPPTPAPPATAPPAPESPKRAVPDYDGRGPPGAMPGDDARWIPRVLLSPAYVAAEYGLRRPIGAGVTAAEHGDWPRKIYNFFTFGAEHKAGFFPVGLVEFNFNPSVGIFGFWDDAGFKGNHLNLHVEAWPTDWLAGSITERIDLRKRQTLQLRLSGIRRPDGVFYGLGPRSLQDSQSRYGVERFEGSALFEWRPWRSSQIQAGIALRDEKTYDGYYGDDPSLTKEAETGAFAVPYGFGREYTTEINRVLLALDTRHRGSHAGSGVRLELGGEQGSDVRNTPAAGWIRYGATLGGYVDLTGRGRILGLSLTTLFADPLGSHPVPFTELVSLGGDHPMAAYFWGRLVDRSAAVATLSYSWPIGPWLDGRLELAMGNVFGVHLAAFDPSLLRVSGAFGLQVAPVIGTPVQLLVGLGTETFAQGGSIDTVRVSLGVPYTF